MTTHPTTARGGRLEVITGPMFSGKSEELMRRVRRAEIAGVKVAVISHSLDTRAGSSSITSHIGVRIPAVAVGDVDALAEVVRRDDFALIAIDEAQFFGPALVPVVTDLVAAGATVIVEGLCVTFDGRPFEPLPTFMALAEDVLKLTAVCTICGRDAVFHRRLADTGMGATEIDPSHVGGLESYVARCRTHVDS
ncbi:thymidine kinase [Brevibacterium sanguinis]|uniref:Thymidine kinase n=2 Tax=Brevibacterium TaxID=1696 RepID=A0A366IN06_9MICO|nr:MULTISPECIES: thymidine kinase [Brevibacterium]RBP66215.1 thymidine kinase [Brevibacterium sanguinis]RBP72866.1 thymidine kinase [Brevibacterium celere]